MREDAVVEDGVLVCRHVHAKVALAARRGQGGPSCEVVSSSPHSSPKGLSFAARRCPRCCNPLCRAHFSAPPHVCSELSTPRWRAALVHRLPLFLLSAPLPSFALSPLCRCGAALTARREQAQRRTWRRWQRRPWGRCPQPPATARCSGPCCQSGPWLRIGLGAAKER